MTRPPGIKASGHRRGEVRSRPGGIGSGEGSSEPVRVRLIDRYAEKPAHFASLTGRRFAWVFSEGSGAVEKSRRFE